MKIKRILMALAVLMMVATPLMAAQLMNVTWQWTNNDPEITQYRYQLDGENPDAWTVVDASVVSYSVEGLDPYKDYTLYLQSTYDGEKWSETATSTAFAMLEVIAEPVVAEVPVVEEPVVEIVEEPAVEAEPVVEAPAEEPAAEVVEEPAVAEPVAEVAEEPVVEEPAVEVEPAAEVKEAKSGFKFNLLFNGGISYDVNLNNIDYKFSGLFPVVGVGLDFQNIVSLNVLGLGLRSDFTAIFMPVDKDWNNLPTSFGELFNGNCNVFIDSSIDMKLMAYANTKIADFYVGGGAGFSVFNPRLAGDTRVEFGHSFKDFSIFSSAWFISGNAGLRVKFNDTVSLAAEGYYRYLLPADKHTLNAGIGLGFTF